MGLVRAQHHHLLRVILPSEHFPADGGQAGQLEVDSNVQISISRRRWLDTFFLTTIFLFLPGQTWAGPGPDGAQQRGPGLLPIQRGHRLSCRVRSFSHTWGGFSLSYVMSSSLSCLWGSNQEDFYRESMRYLYQSSINFSSTIVIKASPKNLNN